MRGYAPILNCSAGQVADQITWCLTSVFSSAMQSACCCFRVLSKYSTGCGMTAMMLPSGEVVQSVAPEATWSLDQACYVQRSVARSTIGGGGRECNTFVPVLGGNGTKIAPTVDIFDQPPGQMGCSRGKLADHVGDRVVVSPGGDVLVTSWGRNRRIPASPIVEPLVCRINTNHITLMRGARCFYNSDTHYRSAPS